VSMLGAEMSHGGAQHALCYERFEDHGRSMNRAEDTRGPLRGRAKKVGVFEAKPKPSDLGLARIMPNRSSLKI